MPYTLVYVTLYEAENLRDSHELQFQTLFAGAPAPPLNLQLIPTPSLHLSWQRPLNLHQEVPVEYRVDIVNLKTMSVVQV